MNTLNIKEELKKIIDTNSRFIRHIKNNVVLIKKNLRAYEVYYMGHQGWSEKLGEWGERKFNSSKRSGILKDKDGLGKEHISQETRVYIDLVENILGNQYDFEIPNTIEIRKVIENKQALSAIRFSKRFDNEFIKGICKKENFNQDAITKIKEKVDLKNFIEWIIEKVGKMINIDKDKKLAKYEEESNSNGNFAVDVSELFLIVNQSLMNQIRLKEIFKEIELTDYFKKLTIIDAELPNNFEGVLVNKRSLWYYYFINGLDDFTDPSIKKNEVYLNISYQLGFIPFVGACAIVKE